MLSDGIFIHIVHLPAVNQDPLLILYIITPVTHPGAETALEEETDLDVVTPVEGQMSVFGLIKHDFSGNKEIIELFTQEKHIGCLLGPDFFVCLILIVL